MPVQKWPFPENRRQRGTRARNRTGARRPRKSSLPQRRKQRAEARAYVGKPVAMPPMRSHDGRNASSTRSTIHSVLHQQKPRPVSLPRSRLRQHVLEREKLGCAALRAYTGNFCKALLVLRLTALGNFLISGKACLDPGAAEG